MLTLRGGNQTRAKLREDEMLSFFVGWQYAAITAIADSISGLNWRIADKKDQEIQHEYAELITPEFLQNIAVFMKTTGTAYVWKVMHGKKVLGLNMLLPQYLSPEIWEDGILKGWKYRETQKEIWLEREEVMVFAELNPNQRYPYITRGYSPLQAMAMTIKGAKEIEKRNYALLTNDVPPWTTLTTEQALSAEQVQQIKQARERNHSGAENAGKMAILPFGIKPINIQSTPKEMEFIAQQNWDRDKILGMYKVPKAILGIGEGVNVGNVKAFNQIFASRCIEPLAKKIARVLNKQLFEEKGKFEFVNVLPTDEEAVKNHYFAWGITRNEYRQELGYKTIEGGDVFIDGTEVKVQAEKKEKKEEVIKKSVDFLKIVKGNLQWTEERMQKRREKKQKKNAEYEKELKAWFLKIFEQQKQDIFKKLPEGEKAVKKLDLEMVGKYYALYHLFIKPIANKILKNEGERAMAELNISQSFNIRDEKLVKKVKEKIWLLAKSIDTLTQEKLRKAFAEGLANNLSPAELKEALGKVFKDLETSRLETIVRTETIRLGTLAEQASWEQSGVVKAKQWRTAIDERVCEHCGMMHGKKVSLSESFFEKGEEMRGGNGGRLKLDYEEVIGSPLHPNCRCDMIPLLD